MNQTLVQKQTQHLAPQQVMIAKMIQATNAELMQLITAETEKNLALEVGDCFVRSDDDNAPADYDDQVTDADVPDRDPDTDDRIRDDEKDFFPNDDDYDDYDIDRNPNISADDKDTHTLSNFRSDVSFREDLHTQLSVMELSDEDRYLANYIVDSLDENGYLSRPLSGVCDDLAFTQMHDTTEDELERVLVDVVQMLEPAGIGARNLRECLLLQLLDERSSDATMLAYDIVDRSFDDLLQHRYERLYQKHQATSAQLSAAKRIISRLNPKPGGQDPDANTAETRAEHIKADFSIHAEDGQLVVTVNDDRVPVVRISEDYQLMQERIQNEGAKSEDARNGLAMIRESINSGNTFIEALRQRHETLLRVIRELAVMQRDYFLSGGSVSDLKPMVLQEVADRTGYDVSTISRVSNSKYIDTDFGIIAVKDLFSTKIQTQDGNSISNREVQERLASMVDSEDKRSPLSDDALSKLLAEQGYPIARRTVASYREQLGIPSARMRRNL
ncbi:MAG: RNA polymerase factor sigma-54 [Bacteroidales bacterium]|nr:RNA polymerase factor sigma-54 [Candidatus Liminaster caballi]